MAVKPSRNGLVEATLVKWFGVSRNHLSGTSNGRSKLGEIGIGMELLSGIQGYSCLTDEGPSLVLAHVEGRVGDLTKPDSKVENAYFIAM